MTEITPFALAALSAGELRGHGTGLSTLSPDNRRCLGGHGECGRETHTRRELRTLGGRRHGGANGMS